jgi:hypothetical protein
MQSYMLIPVHVRQQPNQYSRELFLFQYLIGVGDASIALDLLRLNIHHHGLVLSMNNPDMTKRKCADKVSYGKTSIK